SCPDATTTCQPAYVPKHRAPKAPKPKQPKRPAKRLLGNSSYAAFLAQIRAEEKSRRLKLVQAAKAGDPAAVLGLKARYQCRVYTCEEIGATRSPSTSCG